MSNVHVEAARIPDRDRLLAELNIDFALAGGLAVGVRGHLRLTVDVDLLLTGGFLHDIGKVYEFSFERAVEYTDRGQLLGHLVMEVELVGEKIKTIPDFPEELAMLVKHMIVSHHGALEFGSPRVPQTLEAMILHYLDDLDGKIQSIQSLMEKEREARWTSFHRAYGRNFYRGKPDGGEKD